MKNNIIGSDFDQQNNFSNAFIGKNEVKKILSLPREERMAALENFYATLKEKNIQLSTIISLVEHFFGNITLETLEEKGGADALVKRFITTSISEGALTLFSEEEIEKIEEKVLEYVNTRKNSLEKIASYKENPENIKHDLMEYLKGNHEDIKA